MDASRNGAARILNNETLKLTKLSRCEQIEATRMRKAIRNDVIKQHVKETAVLQKKKEEIRRAFQEEQDQLKVKQKQDEEKFLKEAEERALQCEAEDQQKIEQIRAQGRRATRLIAFNNISKCQEQFCEKYPIVLKLLMACQRTEYNSSLQELLDQFERLISKLKSNDYGPKEMQTAYHICDSLENLEQKIIVEIEQQQQRQLQQVQQQQQIPKAAEADKHQVAAEAAPTQEKQFTDVIPTQAILYGVINGHPSNDVRVTDHPLGREYCFLLLAKEFVSQGPTAITSNAQAAFSIASVLVSLWKLVPELGQLFLAYLYKESPYMMPCFLTQHGGQSSEDFLKQLGYRFINGQLKRLAGVTRLYAACMITNGRQADSPSHPHGLNYAWRWIAKFVCVPPKQELNATIIMEFLQIVSAPLPSAYGKQFVKLLDYMQRVYYPQLDAMDEG